MSKIYIAKYPKKPIRDKNKIYEIRNYLKENRRVRDEFLFTLALNTGRRMGDLVKLRVRDIYNKEYLNFEEEKTKKRARVLLYNIKDDIKEYCKNKNSNDFLFPAKTGKYAKKKHICYNTAYKIFNEIFKKFKVDQSATHTLRKTFAYWHYRENKDLETIRIILNHSCVEITKRYICIHDDDIDNSIRNMKKL